MNNRTFICCIRQSSREKFDNKTYDSILILDILFEKINADFIEVFDENQDIANGVVIFSDARKFISQYKNHLIEVAAIPATQRTMDDSKYQTRLDYTKKFNNKNIIEIIDLQEPLNPENPFIDLAIDDINTKKVAFKKDNDLLVYFKLKEEDAKEDALVYSINPINCSVSLTNNRKMIQKMLWDSYRKITYSKIESKIIFSYDKKRKFFLESDEFWSYPAENVDFINNDNLIALYQQEIDSYVKSLQFDKNQEGLSHTLRSYLETEDKIKGQ
jgi:hypothetical protein